MDALPVTEQTGLPYASKVTDTYLGKEVGVMHACGHDNHVAILMGVASVLTGLRNDLPGTVKFIFQPAEEGAPPGEESGAEVMVKEGVLENPDVDAIFALHVFQAGTVGTASYRSGGAMASAQSYEIEIVGAADPRRPPLGGRGPHRRRGADHHGPADHRQPAGGHHGLARRGDGGHLRERHALQYRARPGQAHRHHQVIRCGNPRTDPPPGAGDRHQRRRCAGRRGERLPSTAAYRSPTTTRP